MSPEGGRLADNIVHFGRMLRRAGLRVGPDRTGEAIRAAEIVGLANREDFRSALRAVFVSEREQVAVFDAAFDLFWRAGHLGAHVAVAKPERASAPPHSPEAPGAARAAAALFDEANAEPEDGVDERVLRLAISQQEALRRRDFAQMTAGEMAAAEASIQRLVMVGDSRPTRRRVASRRGGIDPRRSFRLAMRSGGDLLLPLRRRRAERPSPIVALVDISGSMSAYSRILLHFLHALGRRRRVDTFLFGTRLTNATRALRQRDIDAALTACSAAVPDWSGGTRIGAALAEFNLDWSRRVLGQGAIVLLVTDGLERDDLDRLTAEADRLHRSCRRLVWLNPLLRFDGFEAKARGIRALLPHVDELRPIHSLASVEQLVDALDGKTDQSDFRHQRAVA